MNLIPIEHSGRMVLTTSQLAEIYDTESDRISKNFYENKDRYTEGKHFFRLEGELLKQFKDDFRNSELVGKNANVLYLWTEKGAWIHAKSLNTNQAWESYEKLVDDYYDVKQQQQIPQSMSHLEILASLAQQLVEREKKDAERDRQIASLTSGLETLTENLIDSPDHKKVTDTVNQYARWTRLGHNEVYSQIYDILLSRHGIDVRQRVENERRNIQAERIKKTGKPYTESTLKGKVNGIDIMVRMGCLDKFNSVLVGLLAKAKGKPHLEIVK